MISLRRLLGSGAALSLVCAAMPGQAQLLPPVNGSTQSDNSAGSGRARSDMTVPASGYEPAIISTPQPTTLSAPMLWPEMQAAERPEPPKPVRVAPPNEFESYVSDIVGKPLRRFGSDMLVPESRDFTAPSTTAVPDDYRLNPGDRLRVDLSGSVQANGVVLTIDSEGRIFVPDASPRPSSTAAHTLKKSTCRSTRMSLVASGGTSTDSDDGSRSCAIEALSMGCFSATTP